MTTVLEAPETPPATTLRTDTLAASVILMLTVTVVQRMVGFARTVLVCRWLPPEQLGEWDMALGFLTLAAPLAVFGLPGSFGRYLEHFRQRGQLNTFLRRTAVASAVLACLATVLLIGASGTFAKLIFGRSDSRDLVMLVAACLITAIAYYSLSELFTGLRLYRVSSGLQFFNSITFAVLSVVLVLGWRTTAASMVLAYTGACLAAVFVSLFWLRQVWQSAPPTSTPLAQRAFWSKLMPFALWVWATNWLSNLFEITDRYMLLHYGRMKAEAALELIGQYHSSRVVPVLLVAFAALFASLLIPHLSFDWEAGRRREVVARMNLVLKLGGLALVIGALAIMVSAPVLFGVVLKGKYSTGEAVLPLTLTYCVWFAMTELATAYLWCSEKAGLASLALALGLVLNVGLNLLLVPRLGLLGAVLATCTANLLATGLTYLFAKLNGMQIHIGVWIVSALPLVFFMGWVPTAIALVVVCGLALATGLIFTNEEKSQMLAHVRESLELARNWYSRRMAPAR